jgi:serine protease Do
VKAKLINRFLTGFSVLILGAVFTNAVEAQDANSVEYIAENVTVRVSSFDFTLRALKSAGSGVFIWNKERDYYVLTNNHVVRDIASGGNYVATLSGIMNRVDLNLEKNSPEKDLALFSLSSKPQRSHRLTYANITPGDSVYVSGYPTNVVEEEGPFQFTPSEVTERQEDFIIYRPININNNTQPGMSGGPVLNQKADLIGIHKGGLSEAQEADIDRRGIPIDVILSTFKEELELPNLTSDRSILKPPCD